MAPAPTRRRERRFSAIRWPAPIGWCVEGGKLGRRTLMIAGGEDASCVQPSLYLKRMIAGSGLWVMPKTGHAVNIEEPAAFNAAVQEFFGAVERGSWSRG